MADRRRVTVSTICLELPDPNENVPLFTKEENLATAEGFLKEAGRRGSDIVCLPELFATKRTAHQQEAETIGQGPISKMLSEQSSTWGMYVLGCLYEQVGERVYNSVALFDREGRHLGSYHKVHLPPGEEEVATAGEGFPVFETDFGPIGCLVCFDLHFPEAARSLVLEGADIVFWPTMYSQPGAHVTDVLMRARAIENQVFLVSANYTQKGLDPAAVHFGRSAVVDWAGMVLADTGRRAGLATATIDLDEPRQGFGSPKLPEARRPETYGRLLRP